MSNLAPVAPKQNSRFRLTDIVATVLLVTVTVVLGGMLLKQLSLRHEAAAAKTVSDKLITAMQRQDGTAAKLLGDENFRNRNSDESLQQLFTQTKAYTVGAPTLAKQTVNNGKVNRVVSTYYKFNHSPPFYVRVTVAQANTSDIWRVINFSGNASLGTLEK